ncbi:MAG: hypothetical protein LUF32_07270, partial [Clostridiales bacterium]|nr:hypothetical protein [Clostridiales bacterium]
LFLKNFHISLDFLFAGCFYYTQYGEKIHWQNTQTDTKLKSRLSHPQQPFQTPGTPVFAKIHLETSCAKGAC